MAHPYPPSTSSSPLSLRTIAHPHPPIPHHHPLRNVTDSALATLPTCTAASASCLLPRCSQQTPETNMRETSEQLPRRTRLAVDRAPRTPCSSLSLSLSLAALSLVAFSRRSLSPLSLAALSLASLTVFLSFARSLTHSLSDGASIAHACTSIQTHNTHRSATHNPQTMFKRTHPSAKHWPESLRCCSRPSRLGIPSRTRNLQNSRADPSTQSVDRQRKIHSSFWDRPKILLSVETIRLTCVNLES